MCLAEGVAASDQGDDFFVVHRHAIEGGANVLGRQHVVAAGIGTFRVHVDQTHVGGAKGCGQLAFIIDALGIDTQPGDFGAPVDVLIRFPYVFATGTEAEGAKTHGFQRDVAGENV